MLEPRCPWKVFAVPSGHHGAQFWNRFENHFEKGKMSYERIFSKEINPDTLYFMRMHVAPVEPLNFMTFFCFIFIWTTQSAQNKFDKLISDIN